MRFIHSLSRLITNHDFGRVVRYDATIGKRSDVAFEWDQAKSDRNLRERGFGFDVAHGFDWTTAQMFADDRIDYGEERILARGLIEGRLYIMAFVLRGDAIRIISLRKANLRERRAYVTETGRPLADI